MKGLLVLLFIMSFSAFAQNPVGCCKLNDNPDSAAREFVGDGEIINSCALCGEIHMGFDNVLLDAVQPSAPDGNVQESPEYKEEQDNLYTCRSLSRELIKNIVTLNNLTKDYLVTSGEGTKSTDKNEKITLLRSIETIKIISSTHKASTNIEPKSGAEDNECHSEEKEKIYKDFVASMFGKLKDVKQSYQSLKQECKHYDSAMKPEYKKQEEENLKVLNETISLYDK